MEKLTRDELVKALRRCEDEDCMRCPVAYQPGSLCRGDVESQAADMLENMLTENAALHQIIEKQGTMNKELADKVLEMDAELAQVTAERDAAIKLLRSMYWCYGCTHLGHPLSANSGCDLNKLLECNENHDLYEFGVLKGRQHEETDD